MKEIKISNVICVIHHLSDSSNLKKHILTIHASLEDYKCELCDKSFSQVDNLKRHIHKVHEDYKCDLCSNSFSSRQTLKRHINRVHEGSKDYKCDSCGKSFSKIYKLKTHHHTVHSLCSQ